MFRPFQPISAKKRIFLGVLFFVLFIAAWSGITFSGMVNPIFLANPWQMLNDGVELFVSYNFANDIIMTVWRVMGGFIIAVIVAIPLGILMGAYKQIEGLLEPFISFARYLPASAFVPLLILWTGTGEAQKLWVIFLGSVFQLILMIAGIVNNSRKDLIEAAYTLGASDSGIIKRVVIPMAAPDIAETLRLVLGWAWTYVIVAELIGASSGIGYMIINSQSRMATGQMIFGIIIIGIIGMISDLFFKYCNKILFAWRFA